MNPKKPLILLWIFFVIAVLSGTNGKRMKRKNHRIRRKKDAKHTPQNLRNRRNHKKRPCFTESQNLGSTELTAFVSFASEEQEHCESRHKKKLCDNGIIGMYFNRSNLDVISEEFPFGEPVAPAPPHTISDCEEGGGDDIQCCGVEYVFSYHDCPKQKFDHIYINYQQSGHGPAGEDVPHFDFHAYFITPEERETCSLTPNCTSDICPPEIVQDFIDSCNGTAEDPDCAVIVTCDDLERCYEAVPVDYFPGADSDWECSGCVPGMGNHCTPRETRARHAPGTDFGDNLFMTQCDGIITGVEPMISMEAFRDTNLGLTGEKCVSFETPGKYYFGAGCYPTSYCYGCSKTDPNRPNEKFGINMDGKCWIYLTDYVHFKA